MAARVKIEVSADISGPITGDAAQVIIHDWMDQVKDDVAEEGVRQLRTWVMDKTGRATGAYQDHLATRHTITYHDTVIYDDWPTAVYSPWLEGFSERNRSTRFRGYHLWRITKRRLQSRAGEFAQARKQELIDRLNGR